MGPIPVLNSHAGKERPSFGGSPHQPEQDVWQTGNHTSTLLFKGGHPNLSHPNSFGP